MQEYLFKMFKEFKKIYGIHDTYSNINKYRDLFMEWVFLKRASSAYYVKLFDYMKNDEEVQTYTMAEFGKGEYDTITFEMFNNTSHEPIIISPFAETIKKDSKIEAYTGELVVCDDNVIVKYPNEEDYYTKPNCGIFNDEIGTFMIQVPYTKEELYPILKLIDSYKTLFIGTYGSLSDKNREENLKKIHNLYQELRNVSYRDVNFCSETVGDFYLSALKISSRAKVLKKELTLTRY